MINWSDDPPATTMTNVDIEIQRGGMIHTGLLHDKLVTNLQYRAETVFSTDPHDYWMVWFKPMARRNLGQMRFVTIHRRISSCVLTLLLLLAGQSVLAQEFCFSLFDAEDGLPTARITALTEDKHGHLWIGTDLGISRFNGYVFETFYHDSSYIPGEVNALATDSTGRVWIGTSTGLSVYDDGIFHRVALAGMDTASVQYLLVGESGEIYVSTLHHLHILSHSKDHPSIISHHIENPWHMVQGKSGRIWKGTLTQLLEIVDGTLDTLLTDPQLLGGGIVGLCETDQGLLFGTKSDSIYRLDLNNEHIDNVGPYANENDDFRCFVQWHNDLYAIYSWRLVNLRNPSKGPLMLPAEWDIKFIDVGLVDRDQNLWLGTTEGLILMRKTNFQSITGSSFSSPIHGLYQDADSTIWLGGEGNIYVLNPQYQSSLWTGTVTLGGEIMDITRDLDGNLWLASYWQGIVHWAGDQSVHITSEGMSFLGPDILDLEVDSENHLWVGTTRGLFTRRAGDTSYTFHSYHEQGIADHCDVYKITHEGTQVWVASSCGLYRILDHKAEVVTLPDLPRPPQIRGLYIDDNKLWLGTIGHGVRCYVRDEAQLKLVFAIEDLFPSILDLVANENQIWAGGPNGLLRIQREDPEMMYDIYSPSDGFFDRGFSHLKLLMTFQEDLFLASSRGLKRLDASHQKQETSSRDIIFDEILLDGNQLIDYEAFISLPSSTQTLEVSYYYPDLVESNLVKYRWRMTDQNSWSPWSTDRKMVLYNPKHGNYDLEIQAKKTNRILAQKRLTFVIETPFMQRGPVILVGILLTGFFIYLYNRRRNEHFRLKQKIENERALLLATLEAKALRTQMSPHFLFNILNNLQELIISGENQLAQNYLTKFSRLMRMILNISAREFVRIEREIEFLKLYLDLESLRFDHNFNYKIKAHPDLETIEIPVFMVQPLVENAIKHGLQPQIGSRNLLIQFEHQGDFLVIKVQDNGVGISDRSRLRNFTRSDDIRALDLLRERITILSQKTGMDCNLTIERNKSRGVTSQIRLPLITSSV